MPLGAGAGASTATLIALARHTGYSGPAERLIKACLAVEGASDPLLLPQPDTVLWSSRTGQVLRRFAPPPPATLLGGFWGKGVATDPADLGFPDITAYVEDWSRATAAGDLAKTARIATASARATSALRGPDDPLPSLAEELGALGYLRAHTGSARGLIFAPGTVPAHGAARLRAAGLTNVFQFDTHPQRGAE
jgi:uncharacterized protein involved in propanediol utilization